jgi:hypothetical protein
MVTSLNAIERRLPWSFFGVVLGTISLAIALGFFYLTKREDLTDLQFRVDDEFPLVEVKDWFPDLKVLFKEEDILKSGNEIKILRLRLVNQGRTILQSFYDQNLPFGLSFEESRVLAVSPISPKTGYLCDNLFRDFDPDELQGGRLLFNKPIIERGSQVQFKVYLIQDKGVRNTNITAFGKISGLDAIPVVPLDLSAISARQPGYNTQEVIGIGFAAGYGGMLALSLTIIGIGGYIERRAKRRRAKLSREFVEAHNDISNDQRKMIESYVEGWRPYCLQTIRILVRGDRALDISELVQRLLSKKRAWFLFAFPYALRFLRQMLTLRWDPAMFTVSDGKISLNETNKEMLLTFLRHCDEIAV